MASLWIKLYAEILDDFKYNNLPNNSKLLMYELFLLSRKIHGMDNGGLLPELEEIAFLIHRSSDFVSSAITPLVKINIVSKCNGGYVISNFSERQKADEPKDRMMAYRKRKDEIDGHVTQPLRECYEPVTKRNIDIDIDKEIEQDKDKDIAPDGAPEENMTTDAIKKGDLVDLHLLGLSKQADHILDYPADVQPVLRKFTSHWKVDVPSARNKSQFGWWIKECRELTEACNEYGIDLLDDLFIQWEDKPYSVSHPGALCNTARALVGMKRTGHTGKKNKNDATADNYFIRELEKAQDESATNG